MLKLQSSKGWINQISQVNDWILLGVWMLIGAILRFTNLTAKPPWTDEFATMVFSLGNNFTSVPLNQVISLDTLLQPLRLNPDATMGDVVSLLLHEDNHPPLYFVLVHFWVKLFPALGDYADVWVMRSLPALLGILSIPAVYFLGKIAFSSRLVGQISAALMAVSAYGIFLAQEARHYTLAILFVTGSLLCLVVALKHLYQKTLIPLWLVFSWTIINTLGLSVHYFFCLTLVAEALTLGILSYHQLKNNLSPILKRNLSRICLVVLGTATTGFILMVMVIPYGYGNNMITWIHPLSHILYAISPPFQLLAVWVPMISLLPVESSSIPVVILSGLILIIFFAWFIPYLIKGIKKGVQLSQFRLPMLTLITFISSVIALFLIITYIIGLDLTRAARYSFTYFPAVIVLVGASLGILWDTNTPENVKLQKQKTLNPIIFFRKLYDKLNNNGKLAFTFVWLMGIFGAVTVIVNLGYQKYYRPEQLISVIQETASKPILIATTHKSLVQTGEMMGIGLEFYRKSELEDLSFLLIEQPDDDSPQTAENLQTIITQISHPLELWAVNFKAPIVLNNCTVDQQKYPYIDGYGYQRYLCD